MTGLREDKRYWYELVSADGDATAEIVPDGKVVRRRPDNPERGIIDTGSQAGILGIQVKFTRGGASATVSRDIEVLPVKFDEAGFKRMVEDVAARWVDLALQLGSSVSVRLRSDRLSEDAGLQQRFFFLKSLLTSDDFRAALAYITTSPVQRVETAHERLPLSRGRRLGRAGTRSIARGADRIPIPPSHPLSGLGTLPRVGLISRQRETVDTAENRFVRFILESFGDDLKSIMSSFERCDTASGRRIHAQATDMLASVRRWLRHDVFKSVGASSILPIGSPVMQGRNGYRQLLHAWLRYQTAAEITWLDDDSTFAAGKKDTHKLYEYWLFFQLLDVLDEYLGMGQPLASSFIAASDDGLSLRIKGGAGFSHSGTVQCDNVRPLEARFSYNRTFGFRDSLHESGSWSFPMRPDFTLTLWPSGMSEALAEELQLAIHLHFDSKYRMETVPLAESATELDSLKEQERQGSYRRGDILVAHTYRDAIHRSAGAYILYPGKPGTKMLRQMADEVLPGLGAFPIRPVPPPGSTGAAELGEFLRRVVRHLDDRTSAREQLGFARWKAYGKSAATQAQVGVSLGQESNGARRQPPPNQTTVLVTRLDDGVPWSTVEEKSACPIRLTADDGTARLSLSDLRCDAILIVLDSEPYKLVPLASGRLDVRQSSAGGSVALLPIEPARALDAVPTDDKALSAIAELVGPSGERSVSAETLLRLVTLSSGEAAGSEDSS